MLLPLGLALWLEALGTLEWSFPYCHNAEDGPLSAVFGFPLPYTRWSGVSSMEYDFVPYFYLLNVLIYAAPLVWAQRWLLRGRPRWVGLVAQVVGGVVVAAGVARASVFLFFSLWVPAFSISMPPYDHLYDLRPVGWVDRPHYACTPSEFWFGPVTSP